MAAKKKSHKKLPVLDWKYDGDFPAEGGVLTADYRPKLPPGTFYEDELSLATRVVESRKRVRFEPQKDAPLPKDMQSRRILLRAQAAEAEKKAVALIKQLSKDPSAKVKKLPSLAKAAGYKFER